jgi:hypothetical protein
MARDRLPPGLAARLPLLDPGRSPCSALPPDELARHGILRLQGLAPFGSDRDLLSRGVEAAA